MSVLPPPADRTPPFLLCRDGDDLVLIAPFAKRRHGPTQDEVTLVRSVATHLAHLPAGPCWIDAAGQHTPASIGAAQIRRRLVDNLCLDVRTAVDEGG
jgi:hypothetical protein